jgi:hypothetical protein
MRNEVILGQRVLSMEYGSLVLRAIYIPITPGWILAVSYYYTYFYILRSPAATLRLILKRPTNDNLQNLSEKREPRKKNPQISY